MTYPLSSPPAAQLVRAVQNGLAEHPRRAAGAAPERRLGSVTQPAAIGVAGRCGSRDNGGMANKTERSTERTVSLVVVAALLAAAIIQELRKPPDERRWVGKVAGIVPYDLRRPTFRRLLASVWSPDDSRILMPYGFGVGWTVNVGRLVELARRGNGGDV